MSQECNPSIAAEMLLNDSVPDEGHGLFDHGLMLKEILKAVELTNHKLDQLHIEIPQGEDWEDQDNTLRTSFTSSWLPHNPTASQDGPEFQRLNAVIRDRGTSKSTVKGKKDITATWVDFVGRTKQLGTPKNPASDLRYLPESTWNSASGVPPLLSRSVFGIAAPDGSTAATSQPPDSTAVARAARKDIEIRPAHSLLRSLEYAVGQEDANRVQKKRTMVANVKHMPSFREGLHCASCVLILAHILFMGFEVDMGLRAAKRGEDAPEHLFTANVTFACLFGLELMLRIKVEGLLFITSKAGYYNLFDTFLLGAHIADILLEIPNIGFFRVVRILRLLRVARAMGPAHYFTEVRLMVTSIISTLSSLFWAFLLLLLVLYIVAIAIMQLVEYHVRANPTRMEGDVAIRHDVYEYYGTLGSSLLTLFMSISGGADWSDLVQPLAQFSKAYVLIYVLYVSFVVFGVMNVLTAIFVESASRFAAIDQDLAIQEQLRKDKATIITIKAMFYDADVDNSGVLTESELEALLENPKYIWAMRLVGVDVSEARGLFELLDTNGMQAVSIDEFVTGMMRLKGNAKGVDLASFICEHKRMYADLQESLSLMQKRMSQLDVSVARALSPAQPPRKRMARGAHHGPSSFDGPASRKQASFAGEAQCTDTL